MMMTDKSSYIRHLETKMTKPNELQKSNDKTVEINGIDHKRIDAGDETLSIGEMKILKKI